MDILWKVLWAPVDQFLNLSSRMAYLYLITALIIAIIVYMVEKTRRGEANSVSLLRWLLPTRILLHPSSQTDFAFYVINKIVVAAIFASIFVTSPIAFHATAAGLEYLFGPSTSALQPSLWYSFLATITIILVLDFTLWFAHFLFHKVPFLWDYHKVHHSAEVLTPITAARMHPVEEVADSLTAGLTTGATYAVLEYVLGPAGNLLKLFDINLFLAVFFLAAFHLRHSHVWLSYPYWLQHIFVSPAQHQIHHSVDRKHWDKNMGFIFAFWDWAAGTLYAPKGKEEITFGLGNGEDGGMWHSVRALYLLPFKQNLDRLRRRKPIPHTDPAE